ncbi:MAG: hypothetical protein Q4F88_05705 [Eubacteriales bacterium]|nr:hypothetical protein [Eubacteriales bacterium]
MKKKVDIIIANPAGNITTFVFTPFERDKYQIVAKQLLSIEKYKSEQVSFIKSIGSKNKMEMCGLEFCGNASRSFALICCKEQNLMDKQIVEINVSGSNDILNVEIDPNKNYTKIKMPNPINIFKLHDTNIDFLENQTTIDLGGIMHTILYDVDGSKDNFDLVKNYINSIFNPEAMGVMFYNTKTKDLTPVVYVRDVDTTYFEGSCGSGSTACAIAFSLDKKDGSYTYSLRQPAGVIDASVDVENGQIKNVYIEGVVTLSDHIIEEIELGE